jgi:hypothetical protein
MANQTRDTNDEYPSISDESGRDENIRLFSGLPVTDEGCDVGRYGLANC